MCLKPPFLATTAFEIRKLAFRGKYVYPPGADEYSDQLKDLVSKMIVVNSDKRYSAEQLLEIDYVMDAFDEIFDKKLTIETRPKFKISKPIFMPRDRSKIREILERNFNQTRKYESPQRPITDEIDLSSLPLIRLPYLCKSLSNL